MALDDSDLDVGDVDGENPSPAGTGSRTFLIVASLIGGILLLSIAALGGYIFLRTTGRLPDQQATLRADRAAQNTQLAFALEQTAQAARATATSAPILAPATATASPTLVLAAPTDALGSPTVDPNTATVAALQTTQAALAPRTVTPTASSLPDTGFTEDVGVPGLLGIALVLLVVIFLARRLRRAEG
ncbi:MAG TPA: LPXTG cell wall anchor domain-containing protein [Anaerolineales bacterium]|nr:LPXTG cell wall anchor domain-containing protein [Anaerolineales bacterium]